MLPAPLTALCQGPASPGYLANVVFAAGRSGTTIGRADHGAIENGQNRRMDGTLKAMFFIFHTTYIHSV
jgi:hypothetical protein